MMEVEQNGGDLESANLYSERAGSIAEDSLSPSPYVSGKRTDSTTATTTVGHPSIDVDHPAVDESGTFRCQICFERNALEVSYQLPCEHRFCKECIVNYLFSKITDGNVYPTCFYIEDSLPPPAAEGNNTANRYNACGKIIPTAVIEALLQEHPQLNEKYQRYKFSKENPNARECPYCHAWNIADAEVLKEPAGGRLVCSNTACAKVFCFYHANAHDFDVYPTCAEYNTAMAPQMKASVDLIAAVSKQCPGCQVMVMKSGGCNHMKCQCGVAFCWLCGKQIEDALFPAHFQWWNPSACSNLQMNDDEVPSSCARVGARVLGIAQLVLLGPLTVASTLASSLLCCGCIVLKFTTDENGFTWQGLQTYLSTCMSSWGIFWMIMLFFLPLALAAGCFVVAVGAAAVAITYPCYAVQRIYTNHYPWPDAWTNFVREHCWYARDPLSCRLICCILRYRPRAAVPSTFNGDGGSVAGDGVPPFISLDDHVGEGGVGERNSFRNRPGTPRVSLDLGDTGLAMNDIEANLEDDDGDGTGGSATMRGCACCPPRMADGEYAIVCRHRAASDPAASQSLQQAQAVPEVHVLRAGLFGARGKSGSWTHRSSRTASSEDIPEASDGNTGKVTAVLDITPAEVLELGLSLSTNVTPKSPGGGGSPTYVRLNAVSALSVDDSEV